MAWRKRLGRSTWTRWPRRPSARSRSSSSGGASACSRDWDYKRFREIADSVGALLLADISHPSGLIATGLLNDPLPHCHIVTSTTHKTLRGPRGGIIMVGRDMDNSMGSGPHRKGWSASCPRCSTARSSPACRADRSSTSLPARLWHSAEALEPAYKAYTEQVIRNAQAMAKAFTDRGYHLISGGTDNHLMLIDLRNKDITGKAADAALGAAHHRQQEHGAV